MRAATSQGSAAVQGPFCPRGVPWHWRRATNSSLRYRTVNDPRGNANFLPVKSTTLSCAV